MTYKTHAEGGERLNGLGPRVRFVPDARSRSDEPRKPRLDAQRLGRFWQAQVFVACGACSLP